MVIVATASAQLPRLYGVILYIRWFLKDTVETRKGLTKVFTINMLCEAITLMTFIFVAREISESVNDDNNN